MGLGWAFYSVGWGQDAAVRVVRVVCRWNLAIGGEGLATPVVLGLAVRADYQPACSFNLVYFSDV